MTDLSIRRGDSKNFNVTITESDLVTPVDITAGIIRFAVKKRFDQLNTDAAVFKTTYKTTEIQITNGPLGTCIVSIFAGDTSALRPADYLWDLDLTRRDTLLTNVGAIDVAAGSAVVTGAGLVLTDVLPGDVLAPAGGTPANQKDLVIIAVGGDGSALDPGVGNLLTDFSEWVTELAVSLSIYRGDRKTPVSLSGTFTVSKDVAS